MADTPEPVGTGDSGIDQFTAATSALGNIGMPGTVTRGTNGLPDTYSPNTPTRTVPNPFAQTLGSWGTLPRNPSISGLSQPRTVTQYPQYADGDEWKPAGIFNPDQIRDLQQTMRDAGLYPNKSRITFGVWSPTDAAVYRNVLEGANGSYTDDKTYLKNLLNNPQATTTVNRDPLTIHLTNETDIRSVAADSVAKLYGGGNLDDGTLQAIVDAVHGQESTSQTNAYNMAESGGTVTDPAHLQQTAEEVLKQRNPGQVEVTQFGAAMDNILKTLMGGPLSG